MLKGNKLIKDFKKQNKDTIWDFIEKIIIIPDVYSCRLEGIGPYLPDNTIYIYAVDSGMVVVCEDKCNPKDELADEEPFGAEQPLYFSADNHRVSPVWLLSHTVNLIKQRMKESGLHWPVHGVLITESNFINADDMQNVWDEMNVTVIDRTEPDDYCFVVHKNEKLVFGPMILDIIKKINEQPEQEPSSSDEKQSDEEEEFRILLDEFVKRQQDIPQKDNDENESDSTPASETNEEQSEEEEESSTDSCPPSLEPDLFDFDDSDNYPFGTIEQNNNITVKVKILPPMDNPRAELDKLVGCKDIKTHIDELLTLTRYNKMMRKAYPNAKIHEVSLHSIFFGRPGTGKTTVCKIFGSLLHEAGSLSKGHVVVAERGTFIGTLWGDEERSVNKVLEMAKGGVLMIDEAYLLNSKNDHDPGKIVIQLLMQILADETQRDIAVVLCGYKEPMLKLLDSNPGLHSRFPNRFDFNDFTIDELMEITRRRIGEYRYHFTHQAWQKYKSVLTEAYRVRDPQTWGNARFVANQLERIFIQHAQRCVKENPVNGQRLLTLTQADITPIDVPLSKPRIGF